MPEIIARTSCPICGEPEQVVKINKNGNLYMYCDNRCSVRFNPKESRQAIDQLRTGKTAKVKNMVLVPTGTKISVNNHKNEVIDNGKSGRDTIIRRPDTELAGAAGLRTTTKPGGLLNWLLADDDDE